MWLAGRAQAGSGLGRFIKVHSTGIEAGGKGQPQSGKRHTLTLLGMPGTLMQEPSSSTGQSSYLRDQGMGVGVEGAVEGLTLLTKRPVLCPPGPLVDSATFRGSGLRGGKAGPRKLATWSL